MLYKKAIQELEKEIEFYKNKFENNKDNFTKLDNESLFCFAGWLNFLQFATWLTEKERVNKLEKSWDLYKFTFLYWFDDN